MLSQYADLCAAHEDALVLFQVGDFYEAFCEAAETVARVCEVTLTERSDSTGEYPMAGIPIDAAASYLESLLEADYRVALAEQVEDAAATSGLVDRAVTEVLTPGTAVDDELVESGTTTYVAAVARAGVDDADGDDSGDNDDWAAPTLGLAVVDVTTGECLVTDGDPAAVSEEVARLAPAELIVGPGLDTEPDVEGVRSDATGSTDGEPSGSNPTSTDPGVSPTMAEPLAISDFDPHAGDPDRAIHRHDPTVFGRDAAVERLAPYGGALERRLETDAALRAAGAVLAYAEYTQGDDGPLEYVSRVRRYEPDARLRLDAAAQRSLELFENRGLGASDTVFETLDETNCALGRRCLERWLRRPLVDADAIRSRHDAVDALVDRPLVRTAVADTLSTAYDLERLIARVSRGRADARDLRLLHATLAVVPDLRAELAVPPDSDSGPERDIGDASTDTDDSASSATTGPQTAHLQDLHERLDELAEVRDLIAEAIVADPPQEVTDGGVIRDGFDADLDEFRATARAGREWIADLEARERERTGIDSLSVGHTEVHGYYIEVTDANCDRVPDGYRRRQTLKNSERYVTPGLQEREESILGATARADAYEYELFVDVRERVAAETERIQALARALAELDALTSLATVAVEADYIRPELCADSDAGIEIDGGRHPVVERTTAEFVPNDAALSRGAVAVITGPNMSGKSTYMRQVALTVVLAQVGSFVPAQAARLPVVRGVFTRVGASDDIAGGESTFMREMRELTEILHDAGPDSLVLLDEVGRGTATTDGRAIAQAAVEFIHDELGATTLFATHYHDLTALAETHERITTLHFTATREDGDVTFLHRVVPGAASSSYGVEVAELAGVPRSVVERSRKLVETSDVGDASDVDDSGGKPGGSSEAAATGVPAEVAASLRDLDLACTTPISALNTLHKLKQRVDDAE
jgi:DNA mismatch repair protein MutS